MTSLGTKSGGHGKSGMNLVFRSAAILAISSSSFSNNLMAWVNVREPIKQQQKEMIKKIIIIWQVLLSRKFKHILKGKQL